MTNETDNSQGKRPFWRKLLRGFAFMPMGIPPLLFFTWLIGGVGVAIGAVAMLGAFVQGFSGEPLFGASKPPAAPPAATVVASAPRWRGLWWKVPAGLVGGFVALAILAAIVAPEKPTDVAVSDARAQQAQPPPPATAVTAGKSGAAPAEKYRTFTQRQCNGIDDCTKANIDSEQTASSREFNRTARTSMAKAVQNLGPPTFVLRAGDVVGLPEYERNPTEMRFAHAIVGWSNGACAPNEVHVVVQGGQTMTSPHPGGTYCSSDGSAYPIPGNKFMCAGGRKSDPLCTTAEIVRLPGM